MENCLPISHELQEQATRRVAMSGRVCLVSGGNSGIGFELCRGMAEAGFHVVMVSRGVERGQPALEKLQAEFGASVEMMLCDMSNLDNISKLHSEFIAKPATPSRNCSAIYTRCFSSFLSN